MFFLLYIFYSVNARIAGNCVLVRIFFDIQFVSQFSLRDFFLAISVKRSYFIKPIFEKSTLSLQPLEILRIKIAIDRISFQHSHIDIYRETLIILSFPKHLFRTPTPQINWLCNFHYYFSLKSRVKVNVCRHHSRSFYTTTTQIYKTH